MNIKALTLVIAILTISFGSNAQKLLEGFNGDAKVGGWRFSQAVYNQSFSDDAVEGDSSLMVGYQIKSYLEWGASIDFQKVIAIKGLSEYKGVKVSYKTLVAAKPEAEVEVRIRFKTVEGNWFYASLGKITEDASGTWQEVSVPFSKFKLQDGETGKPKKDKKAVFTVDDLNRLNIQLYTSNATANTRGAILFDNITTY